MLLNRLVGCGCRLDNPRRIGATTAAAPTQPGRNTTPQTDITPARHDQEHRNIRQCTKAADERQSFRAGRPANWVFTPTNVGTACAALSRGPTADGQKPTLSA